MTLVQYVDYLVTRIEYMRYMRKRSRASKDSSAETAYHALASELESLLNEVRKVDGG